MAYKDDLRIAIIGAGMGGLSSALALAVKGFTRIDVYETASDLGFVGAGIQMPPNCARILNQLGCWDEIEGEATKITGTSIRSANSGAVHNTYS
jgi:salicylate hydroxylase